MARASSRKIGVGRTVVLYLKEPREKLWGVLLETAVPGVWFRGLELNSFEDYAHQEKKRKESLVVPDTIFVPYLRVEKIVADDESAGAPSLSARFKQITGKKPAAYLMKEEPR